LILLLCPRLVYDSHMTNELLSVEQMSQADRLAIDGSTPGLELMERAGRAVADHAARVAGERSIFVLCGPGNNGGDGYVAARYLQKRGYRVRIAALGDPEDLTGDARANYKRWDSVIEPLWPIALEEDCIIIDALFGAGLTRDIEGPIANVLNAARDLSIPSIAVDLPSGLNGNTGDVLGTTLPAIETVTFFRKKPGHLLYPGRGLCGEITVVDIGIPETVLDIIKPKITENTPALWDDQVFGKQTATDHKYDRGHLVVAGSAEMSGAARLAARAARRIGAGLVTLSVPEAAREVYLAGDPGNIVEARIDFADTLRDPRRNAVVLGPGIGISDETKSMVLSALMTGKRSVVLDADALSVFADNPSELFDAIQGSAVLTPHEGEFKRLFNVAGDKLTRAKAAASQSGALVILKGADTIIAAPDGRAAINANAPRSLGTAGAGDVLAGIIGGLLAAGAPSFEAACAAVWCHGKAGTSFGPGLIAEDIADELPRVLSEIFSCIYR